MKKTTLIFIAFALTLPLTCLAHPSPNDFGSISRHDLGITIAI